MTPQLDKLNAFFRRKHANSDRVDLRALRVRLNVVFLPYDLLQTSGWKYPVSALLVQLSCVIDAGGQNSPPRMYLPAVRTPLLPLAAPMPAENIYGLYFRSQNATLACLQCRLQTP